MKIFQQQHQKAAGKILLQISARKTKKGQA
jgi:hypothetical protein